MDRRHDTAAEEELFLKLLPVLDHTLAWADEARQLMQKLGVTP